MHPQHPYQHQQPQPQPPVQSFSSQSTTILSQPYPHTQQQYQPYQPQTLPPTSTPTSSLSGPLMPQLIQSYMHHQQQQQPPHLGLAPLYPGYNPNPTAPNYDPIQAQAEAARVIDSRHIVMPPQLCCHQCKTSKAENIFHLCTNTAAHRKKACRKKYCDPCLKRLYHIPPGSLNPKNWICPSCEGRCSCAACVRARKNNSSSSSVKSLSAKKHKSIKKPSPAALKSRRGSGDSGTVRTPQPPTRTLQPTSEKQESTPTAAAAAAAGSFVEPFSPTMPTQHQPQSRLVTTSTSPFPLPQPHAYDQNRLSTYPTTTFQSPPNMNYNPNIPMMIPQPPPGTSMIHQPQMMQPEYQQYQPQPVIMTQSSHQQQPQQPIILQPSNQFMPSPHNSNQPVMMEMSHQQYQLQQQFQHQQQQQYQPPPPMQQPYVSEPMRPAEPYESVPMNDIAPTHHQYPHPHNPELSINTASVQPPPLVHAPSYPTFNYDYNRNSPRQSSQPQSTVPARVITPRSRAERMSSTSDRVGEATSAGSGSSSPRSVKENSKESPRAHHSPRHHPYNSAPNVSSIVATRRMKRLSGTTAEPRQSSGGSAGSASSGGGPTIQVSTTGNTSGNSSSTSPISPHLTNFASLTLDKQDHLPGSAGRGPPTSGQGQSILQIQQHQQQQPHHAPPSSTRSPTSATGPMRNPNRSSTDNFKRSRRSMSTKAPPPTTPTASQQPTVTAGGSTPHTPSSTNQPAFNFPSSASYAEQQQHATPAIPLKAEPQHHPQAQPIMQPQYYTNRPPNRPPFTGQTLTAIHEPNPHSNMIAAAAIPANVTSWQQQQQHQPVQLSSLGPSIQPHPIIRPEFTQQQLQRLQYLLQQQQHLQQQISMVQNQTGGDELQLTAKRDQILHLQNQLDTTSGELRQLEQLKHESELFQLRQKQHEHARMMQHGAQLQALKDKQMAIRQQQQMELARVQALQRDLAQQQSALDAQQRLLDEQAAQQQFVQESHQQQQMLQQQQAQQQQLQSQQQMIQQKYQEAQAELAAKQAELEQEHALHCEAQERLLAQMDNDMKAKLGKAPGAVGAGALPTMPLLPVGTESMSTEAHIKLVEANIQFLNEYKASIIKKQAVDAGNTLPIDSNVAQASNADSSPQVKHEDVSMHSAAGAFNPSRALSAEFLPPNLPSAPHSQSNEEDNRAPINPFLVQPNSLDDGMNQPFYSQSHLSSQNDQPFDSQHEYRRSFSSANPFNSLHDDHSLMPSHSNYSQSDPRRLSPYGQIHLPPSPSSSSSRRPAADDLFMSDGPSLESQLTVNHDMGDGALGNDQYGLESQGTEPTIGPLPPVSRST